MTGSLSFFSDEEMEQLAQTCASSNAQTDDDEVKQFEQLQVAARKCAKLVASTGRQHHQAAWDALLPILDKMQKLLSQRGANHKDATNGLPEWGFWWRDFSRRNNLNISFRTVQYRLNRLRETSSSRKQQRLGLTRQEQIDLAKTAWEGHQLASASITGIGGVDAARSFYSCCLPLENIQEMRDRLYSRRGRPPLKDPTARAKSITLAAGPRIRECIVGLNGEEAADVLQVALSSIAEKYCPGIGLRVNVECKVPPHPTEAESIRTSIDRDAA